LIHALTSRKPLVNIQACIKRIAFKVLADALVVNMGLLVA
jgi:phosphotransferase system IIB component